MDLYIVTGASRGLGKAIADLANKNGSQVATISRSSAEKKNGILAIQQDLRALDRLPALIQSLLKRFDLDGLSSVNLINNAGAVEPVDLAPNLDPESVSLSIQLNLTAPLVLTNAFLKQTSDFRGWRTVVNVSSGVAENPLASWSVYSAAKAGLRNYSHTLASEFRDFKKTRIVSFNPGVMDTEMQAVIRSQPGHRFPEVEKFKAYKNEGKLRSPEIVAKALLTLLESRTGLPKVDFSIQELL